MKVNGHGGDVYAAARELDRDINNLIDFSASINPLGPSPAAWRAIAHSRHLLQHYPDPVSWTLCRVLASQWKRPPEHIVVGNGSSELIYALPRALGLRHLLVLGPTFSEYADAMIRSGGRVTTVFAERRHNYAPPIDRALQLMDAAGTRRRGGRGIDAFVLCNPNSPTGQTCDIDTLMDLVRAAQRHHLWMILDESFAEFSDGGSLLLHSDVSTRVIVLRSLTKFYGLPGLRVGYVVASRNVARHLRHQQPPWSVNALAQVAAMAALDDHDHARRSRAFMAKERFRFAGLLGQLPGCITFPSHANFILMEVPAGWLAKDVTAELRKDGLLVRDCSAVQGLHSRSLRVAVRTKQENNRLIASLAKLFEHR